MNWSRLELWPGVWVDSRRAAWFDAGRTLAIADLHLGYPWALRQAGQLLPVEPPDDALGRLEALVMDYQPARLVVAGDVVHRAVPLPGITDELRRLRSSVGGRTSLVMVAGNHDRHLETLLTPLNLGLHLVDQFEQDGWSFLHGDRENPTPARVVMGHEHPAVRLTDGGTRSAKCPCFLAGDQLLVLPAFSSWAAGTVVGSQPFLSARARDARFQQAIAILGPRLLPVPFPGTRPVADRATPPRTSSRNAKRSE